VRRRSLLAVLALFTHGEGVDVGSPAGAGPTRAAVTARSGGELVVFAAASLSDALGEIARGFEGRTGYAVVFGFGGSGDLARQIRAGAPASVFVSADAARVDELEKAGLVRPAERIDLLSNRLVVVVPSSSTIALRSAADLASLPRLALADPATAPAGAYARQWLERAGAWPALRDRVVPTLDVRAALAAVASASVPAAVVYRTDALASSRVRVALEVPAAEGPRIVYVAALVAGAGPAARAFFARLRTPEARAVFERLGFEVLVAP
jgi:molybdate transport system substrate-binding protein